MAVSEERLAEIRELSNSERVDRVDSGKFTDADWERFDAELHSETLEFCRTNSNSEELHAFADTWNWDAGTEPLQTLLDNPACEAATALLIYWKAAPEFYRQYANRSAVEAAYADVNQFDFVNKLERKFVAGAFPIRRLSFDPNNDEHCGGLKFVGTYDDLKDAFVRELPPEVYEAVIGRDQ